MSPSATPTPVEIGRANQWDIKIRWDNGAEHIFPARYLRLSCPCAACVEEMTGRMMITDEMILADVHPVTIHPVGRYAIQIVWSDGHQTGIFTWERLWQLAESIPK